MLRLQLVLTYTIFALLQSCAGGNKGSKDPVSAGGSSSAASSDNDEEKNGNASGVSSDRKLFVNSMSNNGFTSKTMNRTRANELAAGYSGAKEKDSQTAYGAIVSNRLAGKSAAESFDDARRVMDNLLSKNADAELPEAIQLELALSALQTNKLALTEFYLDRLTRSKNARIKAAAINALGVVAIRMERIPEAVAIFKEALGADKEYAPALLNIGFLALLGGDMSTAKRALLGMQEDWFVDSGLIPVERLEGDTAKAEQRCERVLSKRPKHKPSLINCGILAFQGTRDFKKAREYFNRALAIHGGAAAWDEKTGKLLGVVDADEARQQQAKASKEADERKAKADAEKAKVDAAAAKAGEPAAPAQPATDAPAGLAK